MAFAALDVAWGMEQHRGGDLPRRKLEPRVDGRDDGPALTGPVAIEGAEPGMALEIAIEEVRPAPWGWTFGTADMGLGAAVGIAPGEDQLVRWEIDVEAGCATSETGRRVALRPFPGTIGVAPAEPGLHLAWPPRATGGNMDCRELVAGTTLYLPVAAPGALLSLGDGHAAQGDGEVAGMAIECPLERVQLRLTLHEGPPLRGPRAETPEATITFGFDESLERAAHEATAAMVDVLAERYATSRAEALVLASVAADLRITQMVNGVSGVHCVLPRAAIR